MAATPPAGTPDAPDALPAGARLGEFEILRVLGAGGFGIVYLAHDHALQRDVALKEYLPSSLAGRGPGAAVSVRSGSHVETYAVGLRSFVNEARLLAQFNHPSLVKVYRFWEENGTAYMVMPYLKGRTLRDTRRAMSAPPDERWIRSVVEPLLDALQLLHRAGVYHRDIAPDNILLPPDEPPVLLDFGAARRAIGDRTQAFTAIVKPSYAPIEQYADAGQQRQGPWTDLYALGAVVHYLLRGTPPPPATARAAHDSGPLGLAAQAHAASPAFLAAMEWALSIRPADRPQSVAELREAMDGRRTPYAHSPTLPLQRDPTFEPTMPLEDGPTFAPTLPVRNVSALAAAQRTGPAGAEAVAPAAESPRVQSAVITPLAARQPPPAAVAAPPAARRRGRPFAAMLLGATAIAVGAAAWVMNRPAASRLSASPAAAPHQPASEALPERSNAMPAPALAVQPVALPASARPAPRPVVAASPPRPRLSASRAAPEPQVPAKALASEADSGQGPAQDDPAPGPASPREACGKRRFLALAHCMEQQCASPRFQSHPQCTRVRNVLEDRRQRIEQGGAGGGE